MRTIISFLIYTLIFLVIGAAIYFVAFWRPNSNRVEQLNSDIDAARVELVMAGQRNETYPQLTSEVEQLGNELNQAHSNMENIYREWRYGYLRFLPEIFNELDITERIHRIATPHSHSFVSVDFLDSQLLGMVSDNYNNLYGLQEGIWLTPVNISFTTGYEGLIAILNGFAYEGVDNRIVEYTLHRYGDLWDVVVRMDVLTLTPHSGHTNAMPSG